MDTDSFIAYIKQVIFIKTLQKMLKLNLILQIMNQIDHWLKKKRVIGLMKDELGRKTMTKFVGLRAKKYSYLIDDGSEDKKKRHRNCVIKKTLNLKIIKTVQKQLNLIMK